MRALSSNYIELNRLFFPHRNLGSGFPFLKFYSQDFEALRKILDDSKDTLGSTLKKLLSRIILFNKEDFAYHTIRLTQEEIDCLSKFLNDQKRSDLSEKLLKNPGCSENNRQASPYLEEFESPYKNVFVWKDLLRHYRVIIFGEGQSGKSTEFREKSEELRKKNQYAFFSSIASLVNGVNFGQDEALFDKWIESDRDAFFFLDSVDEAHLKQCELEGIFNLFANKLGTEGLRRARIFISSRECDFREEDILAFGRLLPLALRIDEENVPTEIKEDVSRESEHNAKYKPVEFYLSAINNKQKEKLFQALDITNVQSLLAAMTNLGIVELYNNISDLINLAHYWEDKDCLGSRKVMLEHTINLKLKEKNNSRKVNGVSLNKKREMAELLAFSMFLAKNFKINDSDFQKLFSHCDSEDIKLLKNSTIIFEANSGEFKFCDRQAQEYLFASYLNKKKDKMSSKIMFDYFIKKKFDKEVLIPSRRVACAWLASTTIELQDKLIEIDPSVLLEHGDNSYFNSQVKTKILIAYAQQVNETDKINWNIADYQFKAFTKKLPEESIIKAWKICANKHFRYQLLNLIEYGNFDICCYLAKNVLFHDVKFEATELYLQALRSLSACNADFSEILNWLKNNFRKMSFKLSCDILLYLYAKKICGLSETFSFLMQFFENLANKNNGGLLGDDFYIKDIFSSFLKIVQKNNDQLLLAKDINNFFADELSKQKINLVEDHYPGLIECLLPLASDILKPSGIDPNIVKKEVRDLLLLLERGSRFIADEQEILDLKKTILSHQNLAESLFISDINICVESHDKNNIPNTFFWWPHFGIYCPLWDYQILSLSRIEKMLQDKPDPNKSRLLIKTYICVCVAHGQSIDLISTELEKRFSHFDFLSEELKLLEEHNQQKLKMQKNLHKSKNHNTKKSKEDDFITKIKEVIASDPTRENIRNHLDQITYIERITNRGSSELPGSCLTIRKEFSADIFNLYKEEMYRYWREYEAYLPSYDGHYKTIQSSVILGYQGINIELNDRECDCPENFTDNELIRMAEYGLLSGISHPEWLDKIISTKLNKIDGLVKQVLRKEYNSNGALLTHHLEYYAHANEEILEPLTSTFLEIFLDDKVKEINHSSLLDARDILAKLNLPPDKSQKILDFVSSKLSENTPNLYDKKKLDHLVYSFPVNPNKACLLLLAQIDKLKEAGLFKEILEIFIRFFGSFTPLIREGYDQLATDNLLKLVLIAHEFIKPEEDNFHENGVLYSPKERDKAESARSLLFSWLKGRGGEAAYKAMMTLSEAVTSRKTQYLGQALEMLETAAEPDSMTIDEILKINEANQFPIKSKEDFFKYVLGLLEELFHNIATGDTGIKGVIRDCKNENDARDLITEFLKKDGKNYLEVYREHMVVDEKRIDVCFSSSLMEVNAQVSLELKIADNWTFTELKEALHNQLVNKYLLPKNRSHGIFCLIYQGKKQYWLNPDSRERVCFSDLVKLLNKHAKSILENKLGDPVSMSVVGLNLAL